MIPAPNLRNGEFQQDEVWFARPNCAETAPAAFSTFSDIRFARIDAIKARIAAGTYRVSTADLADNLMQCMLLPH